LRIHFPLGGSVGFPLHGNVGDLFRGRRKYRLPAEYSIGILALQSRISILATGSWKLSQQYNGRDKIDCFSHPRAWQRRMAQTTCFCRPGAYLRGCAALKPFNR
jgi:hypothetical protein